MAMAVAQVCDCGRNEESVQLALAMKVDVVQM